MIDPQQRTVTLKLTRHEVCKLLISMTAQYEVDPDGRKSIYALHEKIAKQLAQHDGKRKEDVP